MRALHDLAMLPANLPEHLANAATKDKDVSGLLYKRVSGSGRFHGSAMNDAIRCPMGMNGASLS